MAKKKVVKKVKKVKKGKVAAVTAKSGKKRVKKTKKEDSAPPKAVPKKVKKIEVISDDRIEAKAISMSKKQKEISVSEFFAKNRHLLGFDNPRKALLTTVKEAVDNSLDACEEAHILPDIIVEITQINEERFIVAVQDNGPGIVKAQIPNIFGRLLYGSKFHALRMSRGQQGIGISAAGMYGLITTGKPVIIRSKTGPRAKAHYYELQINTKQNRPEIKKDDIIEWDTKSGTRVEIEMIAKFQKGRRGVDEYLAQTAIVNPHAEITFIMPDGEKRLYERSVSEPVDTPEAVKPHPYGVELGVLLKMCHDAHEKTMTDFLISGFSRVSPKVSQEILKRAKIKARTKPQSINHVDAEHLHKAINETKIMAPSTSSICPIGEEALLGGIKEVVKADFYTTSTRPATVYRGNPFLVEVAIAWGGTGFTADQDAADKKLEREQAKLDKKNKGKEIEDAVEIEAQLARILRFANRVPLQYQQSACAIFQSIVQTNWRSYGVPQSRGALPSGPLTVLVHMGSVWVPFTSESKEAVAHYPEIIKEIRLALSECGRRLGRYLKGIKREKEELLKRSYIKKYMPAIGEALQDILNLKDKEVKQVLVNLEYVLDETRAHKIKPKLDAEAPVAEAEAT